MSLIAKLKRRNVFRSALAYAVAAWLLVEVMELITDTFGAPEWVLQVFVSLAVIGIVPVVLFSWMYEITPEGIKRESEGNIDHSAATTQKLNVAIVIMLAIAIGLFGYQQFSADRVPVPDTPPATTQTETPRTNEPDTTGAAQGVITDVVTESSLLPMVAVLPFTTVSLDGESDFFAVGVHDDLLTQLAKMESMRVISRTSVLEYKDTKKNIRDIGDELGADIIMEGGIQAAGGRIRINAQLIDADTDEHLWAETYDRELSAQNIFEVQGEIASAIANALNTTLTVQDNVQLREIPTENMAAYRAYHQAMDIWYTRGGDEWVTPYIEALKEAISLDPNYIRPRAELVGIIALDAVGMVEIDPEIAAQAERELEAIRQIAPDSAEYLIAQAYYIYYILRDYEHAHEVVSQALARNPSDVRVLEMKGWIERRLQNWDQRLETMRQIMALDPRNEAQEGSYITNLLVVHHYDELVEALAETRIVNRWLDYYRALMTLREDGDFERYMDSTLPIFLQDPDRFVFRHMQTLWLNGRFDEALERQADFNPEQMPSRSFPLWGFTGLINYWLADDEASLIPYVDAANKFLDQRRDEEGNIREISDFVLVALLAAVQGQRETTLQAVHDFEDAAAVDPTHFLDDGPSMCWILGIAEATAQAVRCLRRFLDEPSYANPFVDPHMPVFNVMRDEPEFVALMADIEAGLYD